MSKLLFLLASSLLMVPAIVPSGSAAADDATTALSLVVMDPLAAPLSCPCVEGYAQRDYEVLAEYLQSTLDRPVELTFAESLAVALQALGGQVSNVREKVSGSCCKETRPAGAAQKRFQTLTFHSIRSNGLLPSTITRRHHALNAMA